MHYLMKLSQKETGDISILILLMRKLKHRGIDLFSVTRPRDKSEARLKLCGHGCVLLTMALTCKFSLRTRY